MIYAEPKSVELNQGVYYVRKDGVAVRIDEGETWVMRVSGDGTVNLTSFSGGKVDATYRTMEKDEAAVAMAAIIQGFEPPRTLVRPDTPVR
jgi:hypothetical protein